MPNASMWYATSGVDNQHLQVLATLTQHCLAFGDSGSRQVVGVSQAGAISVNNADVNDMAQPVPRPSGQ